MARETAREKGGRLLLEGRVIVTSVSSRHVTATIRGEGHMWIAAYRDGRWVCDCPARTDACSHLHALRRVTAPDLPGEPR